MNLASALRRLVLKVKIGNRRQLIIQNLILMMGQDLETVSVVQRALWLARERQRHFLGSCDRLLCAGNPTFTTLNNLGVFHETWNLHLTRARADLDRRIKKLWEGDLSEIKDYLEARRDIVLRNFSESGGVRTGFSSAETVSAKNRLEQDINALLSEVELLQEKAMALTA